LARALHQSAACTSLRRPLSIPLLRQTATALIQVQHCISSTRGIIVNSSSSSTASSPSVKHTTTTSNRLRGRHPLFVDEIREALGLLAPDHLPYVPLNGGSGVGGRDVIYITHAGYEDYRSMEKLFRLETAGNFEGTMLSNMFQSKPNDGQSIFRSWLGSFDTQIAAQDSYGYDTPPVGNSELAHSFGLPLKFYRPEDNYGELGDQIRFEGQHHSYNDALVTLMNAIAMALRLDYGITAYPKRDVSGQHSDQNPSPHEPIDVYKFVPVMRNAVLVAFDAEFQEYSFPHPTRRGLKGGVSMVTEKMPKEVSFVCLDMNAVRHVAPGPQGKNWWKYMSGHTLHVSKTPSGWYRPKNVTMLAGLRGTHSYDTYRQLAVGCKSLLRNYARPLDVTAFDIHHPVVLSSFVALGVPANVGSLGPEVNFDILPRPGIDYDWVEDMPAPYPNPPYVPDGVSFGHYLECLQEFCPQHMQANHCTTISTCNDQGRYFTCPDFRKGECTKAFSHGGLQHSRVNCRARDPTKPCKYQAKSDSTLDNSNCLIRIQYAHILPMCRSIKDNVACLSGGVSGGCRFGHDNVHMRLNVAAERQGAKWAAERAHLS
jgi:hypothetical protein